MRTDNRPLRRLALAALTALIPAGAMAAPLPESAMAAPRTLTVASDRLGDLTLLAPPSDPDLFVILVSGYDGLTDDSRADAEALVAEGAAVALIDLNDLVARFGRSDDTDCHYVFGAFEDFTRVAERTLGLDDWLWPVLYGRGAGGTLAYLALAQAPANTAAGAVSVAFAPTLATRLPLCPGAPQASSEEGSITYAPFAPLPGRWAEIDTGAPAPDAEAFLAHSKVQTQTVDAGAVREAAVAAVMAIGGGPADPLSDLPLVELPASDPKAFAIFISGDGGWRDLDKTIGEIMSKHNVSVIGVDSLRYFWSRKTPEEVAADIDRIVAHYRKAWSLHDVALLGYSLGADALVPAWSHLSKATQDDTVFVGLLGLAPKAALEVTVTGWLGLSSANAIDLRPALATLPAERITCFYGKVEAANGETACTFPELGDADREAREGGHHFDGNYDAIASLILKRIKDGGAAADR